VWKTLVKDKDTQMFVDGSHLTVFYPISDINEDRVALMNEVYRESS
jgi:hypothetical protein